MKFPQLYMSSQVYPNILDVNEFSPTAPAAESGESRKQRLLAEHAEAYAKSEPLPIIPIAAGLIVGQAVEGDTVNKIVAGIAATLAASFALKYLDERAKEPTEIKIGDRLKTGSDLTAALFEAESARRDAVALQRQIDMELRDAAWKNQVANMQRQWQENFMRQISSQRPTPQPIAQPKATKAYPQQAKAYVAPRGRVSQISMRKA